MPHLPLIIASCYLLLIPVLYVLNVNHNKRHTQLWSPLLAVSLATLGICTIFGIDTLITPLVSAAIRNIPQQWHGFDLTPLRNNPLAVFNFLLLAAMLVGKVLFRLIGATSWLLLRIASFITGGLAANIVISFLYRMQQFLWSKGVMPGYFWHEESYQVKLKWSSVFVGRVLRFSGWTCAGLAAVNLYIMLAGDSSDDIATAFLGNPQLTTAALIVLLEFGWYLDGKLPANTGEHFIGADTQGTSKGSCRKILDDFSKRWNKCLLASKSQLPTGFYYSQLPTGTEKPEQKDISGAQLIIKNLYRQKIYLDENQQLFLESILKGESVLALETHIEFTSPIIFAHVQKNIFANNHILFLQNEFPGSTTEEAYRRFIHTWMGKPLFAPVKELPFATPARIDGSERIMLASTDTLLQECPWSPVLRSWLEKISLVVILDAPSIIYPNAFMTRMALRLLESCTSFQVIVRSPHDRTNTESSLRSLFSSSHFKEFRFHSRYSPDACYAIWKSDRRDTFQNILAIEQKIDFTTALSCSYALAYGAMKEYVPLIHMQECIADHHFREELARQPGVGPLPAEKLKNQPLPFAEGKSERVFTIIENHLHHLVIALNKALTTASFGTFANVITGSYLLREYHAANSLFFLTSGMEMPPLLAPDLSYSKFSAAFELFLKGKNNMEVPIADARNILRRTVKGSVSELELMIEEMTTELMEAVLDEKGEYFCAKVSTSEKHTSIPYLTISFHQLPKTIEELTASYEITEYLGDTITKIPAYLMPQPYLGQIIHLNEKPYLIDTIDYHSHTLTVRYFDDYIPITDKLLRDINEIKDLIITYRHIPIIRNDVTLNINRFEASYTVSTNGFIRFQNKNNRIDDAEQHDFRKGNMPKLLVPHGQILSIVVSSPEIADYNPEQKFQFSASLVLLLQELMVSVFPETAHSLLVTSPALNNDAIDVDNDKIFSLLCTCSAAIPDDIQEDNDIQILIVEASLCDLGMCQALANNWDFLCESISDYLVWRHAEQTDDHDDYLAFGRGTTPAWLMIEDMKNLFCRLDEAKGDSLRKRRLSYWGSISEEASSRTTEQRFCDFCGIHLSDSSYTILDDGREQCQQCLQDAVTDIGNLQQLYHEARWWLVNTYRIKLRKNITIHFASAEEIMTTQGRIFLPTPDFDRRPVGIAIRRGNDFMIYIENAQPYFKTLGIITHEMTHIWQYDNLNMKQIENEFGDLLIEGHAQTTQITLLEEKGKALDHCRAEKERSDLYGQGYRLLKKFLIQHGTDNPFIYLKGKYGA